MRTSTKPNYIKQPHFTKRDIHILQDRQRFMLEHDEEDNTFSVKSLILNEKDELETLDDMNSFDEK